MNLEETAIRKLFFHTNYTYKCKIFVNFKQIDRSFMFFRSNFNGTIHLIFRIIIRGKFLGLTSCARAYGSVE